MGSPDTAAMASGTAQAISAPGSSRGRDLVDIRTPEREFLAALSGSLLAVARPATAASKGQLVRKINTPWVRCGM